MMAAPRRLARRGTHIEAVGRGFRDVFELPGADTEGWLVAISAPDAWAPNLSASYCWNRARSWKKFDEPETTITAVTIPTPMRKTTKRANARSPPPRRKVNTTSIVTTPSAEVSAIPPGNRRRRRHT